MICYACKDKLKVKDAHFLVPPWDERDRSTPQSPVPFCAECYDAIGREVSNSGADPD